MNLITNGLRAVQKTALNGVFIRDRKLPLKNLVILIMSSCSSIQRDLDRFFKSMDSSDFNIRKVTKSAFTQARKKLNTWAFKRLNEVSVNTFYENNEIYTWYGMRVMRKICSYWTGATQALHYFFC
jgi:hypothetical protein